MVTHKLFRSTAVDLFAGAGGVTAGLKAANIAVLAAVEIDSVASATYAANHEEVNLFQQDILDVSPDALLEATSLAAGDLGILTACAPCQGYSTLGTRNSSDPRNDLVAAVLPFVERLRPRMVAFENVPGLRKDRRFNTFVAGLKALGYGVKYEIADAANFQVPQRRRRLVLIAADGIPDAQVPFLSPTSPQERGEQRPIWVRDAWENLKPIDSGDPLHRTPHYPDNVLARIRAVPKNGGSRHDLPPELRLHCHIRLTKGASSAYGRMQWDDVAPTMTTRCDTPACGRFLHPEEDRAITLREAAALQTFDPSYHFAGGRMAIAAQIGNAVPVRLAEAIGRLQTSNNPSSPN